MAKIITKIMRRFSSSHFFIFSLQPFEREKRLWCVMLEHNLPKNNYRAELKPYLTINPVGVIWKGTICGTFLIFYFICRISLVVARTGYRVPPVFFSTPTTAFGLQRCSGESDILFQTFQSKCQRYSNDIIYQGTTLAEIRAPFLNFLLLSFLAMLLLFQFTFKMS